MRPTQKADLTNCQIRFYALSRRTKGIWVFKAI